MIIVELYLFKTYHKEQFLIRQPGLITTTNCNPAKHHHMISQPGDSSFIKYKLAASSPELQWPYLHVKTHNGSCDIYQTHFEFSFSKLKWV